MPPSLDYVIDLTDKLKSQRIDYAMITVQRGSKGPKVHLFYSIPDLESVENVAEGTIFLTETLDRLHKTYLKSEKKIIKKRKKKDGNDN